MWRYVLNSDVPSDVRHLDARDEWGFGGDSTSRPAGAARSWRIMSRSSIPVVLDMTRQKPARTSRATDLPPLWQCPTCGHRFSTRNQWHACYHVPVDALFERSEPVVRDLFDRMVRILERWGQVTVVPQKSRIALQVRMRFAAVMPQKAALRGHLVLARRTPSRHFTRIDTFSPRNHVHVFRLLRLDDLDEEFIGLLGAAYRVGRQAHWRDADSRRVDARRGSGHRRR